MKASVDHYQRLRVTRDATRAQIRAAYLRLVALHHPDRSVAADAADITAELNEAYSVLEDEQKRRDYDDGLRAAASAQNAAPRGAEPPRRRAEIPQIRCDTCGVVDSTLRSAEFIRCVSFIKNFSRVRDAGVRCQACRNRAAVKANLISGIFGWWSPGGLFYAPHALWVNTGGGARDRPRNALLLRTLGHQLFARGDLVESVRALRESIALAPDERTSKLLEYASATAGGRVASRGRRSFSPFLAAVIAPALFSACGVWVARYPLPEAISRAIATPAPAAAATKAAAPAQEMEVGVPAPSDPYVARLANLVEIRSPIVGTHSEAGKIVREHEIDRSRFEVSEIDRIADAIAEQIGAAEADPRVVAAYFNARMLALSIHLINALRSGQPVGDHAAEVQRLLRWEPVATWLRSSAYAQPAADLQKHLRTVAGTYTGGPALSTLEDDLSKKKQELAEEEMRLEIYRRANLAEYKARVDDFNREVRSAKAAMREYRRRRSGVARLEAAFNRCLDPKILFTRFGRVEITTVTSGIDEPADDADSR